MTFKELAEFILSQDEALQNEEARLVNIDNGDTIALDGDILRFIHLIDKDAIEFQCLDDYTALPNSCYEIDPEYIHYIE